MAIGANKPEHFDEPESEGSVEARPEDALSGGEPQDRALAEATLRWQETLRGLEEKVRGATDAINFLRESLREVAPLLRGIGELDAALRGLSGEPSGPPAHPREVSASRLDVPPVPPAAGTVGSEQPWRDGPGAPPTPAPPESGGAATGRRGLDLLPRSYTITVEDRREDDRRSKVDLAPLHRALTDVEGVRDVHLVSYAHGVASIAVQAQGEIDTAELQSAVAGAMQRECSVVARDEQRIHVRMAER